MAVTEKALTGHISRISLTGVMKPAEGLTGYLNTGKAPVNDYSCLANKPCINGVMLISDLSFEELGDHILTNDEISEMLEMAGF